MFEVTKMYEAIVEKAVQNSQVRIREMSESEPTDEVTKSYSLSKPKKYRGLRDKYSGYLDYWLCDNRHQGGMTLI